MILCDPFACNTLVLSTVRNLQELLSQDALPRVRTWRGAHCVFPCSMINNASVHVVDDVKVSAKESNV